MKKYTFDEALNVLKVTRDLRTDLLQPLNLSFELFLRYSQFGTIKADRALSRLIQLLEKRQENRR